MSREINLPTQQSEQTVLRTHRREPGVLGELNSGAKSIAKSFGNTIQMLEHTIVGAGFTARTYRVEAAEDYAITRHTAFSTLQLLGYSKEQIETLFGQL